MSTITLDFTEEQYDRIRRLADENGFADPAPFIRSLIQSGLEFHGIEGLERKIMEGFESELSDWTSHDLEDIRREGRKLMESRKAVER